MALPDNLHILVDDLAPRLDSLNLSGDDQEAYSTMLCRLENQADREDPDFKIVVECVTYSSRYSVSKHAA
jgi:hypothetical protein